MGHRMNVLFLEKTFPNIAGHLVSASIMSAPAALLISKVIGERTVATEVAGYQDLAALLASGGLQYPGRSALIATCALCGFAHVASLGIFVGGLAALVPSADMA